MKKLLIGILAALLLLQTYLCVPAQALTFGSFLDDEVPAPTFLPDIDPEPAPTFLSDSPAQAAAVKPDIPVGTIRDNGVIRVYLLSLDNPSVLNITLSGIYTVDHDAGFRFDNGTQITLTGGESILLSAGGLTIDMGRSLTLTRQASDLRTETGLYIEESEKNNLYAGDLSLSLDDNGGLRPILTINIEDYLLGVVAYEMSDAWPLEALKAQAVAARTYAMQRKSCSTKKDYDLVDTTSDQVYKGFDPETTNVIRAVTETNGVVGTFEGGFPVCYYTASNGGETALPTDVWPGSSEPAYLSRHADPYDLENPLSVVKSVAFDPEVSNCEPLKEMLQAGLDAIAAAQGREAEELQFESVLSVKAADPVAEGSIMCRTLCFTVSATGLNVDSEDEAPSGGLASVFGFLPGISSERKVPERASLNETFEIALSVYDQIKDGLRLSINDSDYEIASVQQDSDGFVISVRRFGHGVGMSQRGAQTMAGSHALPYTDILAFYYPGMTLERIEWKTPELISLENLPSGTSRRLPEPTATPEPAPLPALKDGEYYARVTASLLNMREARSTQSPIVERLDSGFRLIVSGEADADGWVSVHTAQISGYVKLEYLKAE